MLSLRVTIVFLCVLCHFRPSPSVWASVYAASTVNMTVAAHREFHNLYRKFNETAINLGQKLKDGLIQKSFGNLATNERESTKKLPHIYADELQLLSSKDGGISSRIEGLLHNVLWMLALIDVVMLVSVLFMCNSRRMESLLFTCKQQNQ